MYDGTDYPRSMLPTLRFRVTDPDDAVSEITTFLQGLPDGERRWCEVLYPAPAHLSAQERALWDAAEEDTFDAVELIDGVLVTLPPYEELVS